MWSTTWGHRAQPVFVSYEHGTLASVSESLFTFYAFPKRGQVLTTSNLISACWGLSLLIKSTVSDSVSWSQVSVPFSKLAGPGVSDSWGHPLEVTYRVTQGGLIESSLPGTLAVQYYRPPPPRQEGGGVMNRERGEMGQNQRQPSQIVWWPFSIVHVSFK